MPSQREEQVQSEALYFVGEAALPCGSRSLECKLWKAAIRTVYLLAVYHLALCHLYSDLDKGLLNERVGENLMKKQELSV